MIFHFKVIRKKQCTVYNLSNDFVLQILAHSWEVIERNDNEGLKNLSEEGLESLQKHVRNIR